MNFTTFCFFIFLIFFGRHFFTHDIYPLPHPRPTTSTHYPRPTTFSYTRRSLFTNYDVYLCLFHLSVTSYYLFHFNIVPILSDYLFTCFNKGCHGRYPVCVLVGLVRFSKHRRKFEKQSHNTMGVIDLFPNLVPRAFPFKGKALGTRLICSRNWCQIQIGIPTCVMSSEYFTRTSLYLVRLKIFEWIKLLRRHLRQIQGN